MEKVISKKDHKCLNGKTLLLAFFFCLSLFDLFGNQGVLDLREVDFEKDGIQLLNGDWGFYWNRFLAPENAFSKAPKMYIRLPAYWNNNDAIDLSLPDYGYASFTLKILLPETGMNLALKFKEVMTACNIYINGTHVSSIGKPGISRTTSRAEIDPHDIYFYSEETSVELLIHFSNFQYKDAGMPRDISLGLKEQIEEKSREALNREFFILGIFAFMFLYHIFLFIFRPVNRSPLLFALFCLLISIRTSVTGETILSDYIQDIPFELMIIFVHGTVYLALPVFFLFVWSLFREEMSILFVRVTSALGLLLFIFAVIAPARIHSRFMDVFLLIMGLGMLYTLFVVIQALVHKRQGAILFIVGLFFILVTYVNDYLFNLQLIDTFYASSIGLFLFIFFQSLMLSSRFSRAFHEVENLSERLLSLDKLKDNFLATTSHELRTPLNGIIGIAETTKALFSGEISEIVFKNLSLITASGKRLANLVNDILDYSRLKERDIQLNLALVDLKVAAELVIASMNPLAAEKKITI